jgi:hypothetical protein
VTITAPVSTEAAAWYGLSVEEVVARRRAP